MAYRLNKTSVVAACNEQWPHNKSECNKFVQAVAQELGVLIPGSAGDANLMTWWIKEWFNFSGVFQSFGPNVHAAIQAIQYANAGRFVIAGMTSEELDKAHDWHPPMALSAHGHVAVVTPGFGRNGWPKGYWGAHGSVGKENSSLSEAFPWRHPELVRYFVCLTSG